MQSQYSSLTKLILGMLICAQRESTATIKNAPQAYIEASPPKKQNIIEFDCRGLEFTAFKADARCDVSIVCVTLLTVG